MSNLAICQNLPNQSLDKNSHHSDSQLISNKTSKAYWFLKRKMNPDYESGLKHIPVRSCLLLNNVLKNEEEGNWVIKTKPKWQTDLLESVLDRETGEILSQGVYATDDLRSGNNRKIKAVNRFCKHFTPLYRRRRVSLFFGALTLANQSKVDIRTFMKLWKQKLKRNKVNVLGFIWVLEISEDYHIHYHFILATDRLNFKGKGMPEFMKPSEIWGCRTSIEFIKFDVRYYLGKYFTKCQYRILNRRSYGISMP